MQGLVKSYPGQVKPAVNGMNLSVPKGILFGLLGANGAGKSTSLALLCGLATADSGTIDILGRRMTPDAMEIKQSLGFVPQDIALYDNLSGRENLRFFGRLYGLQRKRLKERIEFCLHFAGLTARADQPVSTYSGGMKRRLNIAVALIHEPEILFLDEPTVGIDAQSRQLIHEQLLQLVGEGISIIYTTHYMEEAQHLCSLVAIMDEGEIVAMGSPARLMEEYSCRNLEECFFFLTGKELRD
ncbi:MAG: ABC transporter ATP-binding protein [Proteobacteria bacterium]|nr:ABC transporter ATP-binding protein [Pseudomonadota bacterium]MBU1639042.1 ABC transporter ATP-binding protein [Pseudomonadota bacterium]